MIIILLLIDPYPWSATLPKLNRTGLALKSISSFLLLSLRVSGLLYSRSLPDCCNVNFTVSLNCQHLQIALSLSKRWRFIQLNFIKRAWTSMHHNAIFSMHNTKSWNHFLWLAAFSLYWQRKYWNLFRFLVCASKNRWTHDAVDTATRSIIQSIHHTHCPYCLRWYRHTAHASMQLNGMHFPHCLWLTWDLPKFVNAMQHHRTINSTGSILIIGTFVPSAFSAYYLVFSYIRIKFSQIELNLYIHASIHLFIYLFI